MESHLDIPNTRNFFKLQCVNSMLVILTKVDSGIKKCESTDKNSQVNGLGLKRDHHGKQKF
jgi:hypothetical protein